MNVRKVKGGYRVESYVDGYPFGHTYIGYNRVQAISKHRGMENLARRYGGKWIDTPIFNEYE